MKWIWKFHDWYDGQKEPWRFLLLLVLVSPIITVTLWVDSLLKAGLAVAWLILILAPRMYRHHGLLGR